MFKVRHRITLYFSMPPTILFIYSIVYRTLIICSPAYYVLLLMVSRKSSWSSCHPWGHLVPSSDYGSGIAEVNSLVFFSVTLHNCA
jgi:hypothetical protein